MAENKTTMIPTWLGLVIMVVAVWAMWHFATGGRDMSVPSSRNTAAASSSNIAADQEAKEFAWVERGKDAARAKLKDPDSAQFRNVYFHEGADGVPMACGEVNSKNSFGGYGGFQKFMSAGDPELTFMAEQMEPSEFATAWNRFCAR